MKHLHVVNASAIEPLIESVNCSYSHLERALQNCNLQPESVLFRPSLVPLHSVEHFLSCSGNLAGDPAFSFFAFDHESTLRPNSVANVPLQPASTSLEGVNKFALALDGVSTGSLFVSSSVGSKIWILRLTDSTEFSDHWSTQLYSLGGIRSGMERLFFGRIKPIGIRLHTLAPEFLPEELADLPIELGYKSIGLAYDLAEIAEVDIRQFSLANTTPKYTELSDTTPTEISRVLRNLISSTHTDKLRERAARSFGVSLRTYQRRLSQLGTTHAKLLVEARIFAARELLVNASWSIIQISLELGYSHPSDFSRFFKSKIGVSPQKYRQMSGA